MTTAPNPARLLYTVAEAAELLSLGQDTVRQLIRMDYLPVRRIGRLQRIHRQDLEALAKQDIPSVWPHKPWPEQREKKEGAA